MNLTTVEIIKALRLEPEFQQAIKENNSKPIEIYQGEGINKKAFTVVIIRMRNKAVSYPNVIDVPFNTGTLRRQFDYCQTHREYLLDPDGSQ